MKVLKRNFLILFILVSVTCFSQDFSDICRTGTLNEIIKAIHNNADKDEQLKYDKKISKYKYQLDNNQQLLNSLNSIDTTNNNNNIYSSQVNKNQEMINSLLKTQLYGTTENYNLITPDMNKTDITNNILKTDKNKTNIISKNVIDALKYNPNLSAGDKKKILQILSMR